MKKLEENKLVKQETKQETKQEIKQETKQQKLYTKDAVLKSKRFAEYKDVFQATLNDEKRYSMEELKDILEKFQGKKE